MSVREPIAAGQFYEFSADKLNSQIESCFLSRLGPGSLPSKRTDKKIFGCISPHAGYQFSGPCAAFSFKEIAESKFPLTFVIIGPNHTGYGSEVSALSTDFETPLGTIKVDKQFITKLTSKCDFLEEDHSSHAHEHSVEVQLPFLQYVSKDNLKNLKFVPLVLGAYDLDVLKELGKAIASIGKNACIIASSDFTHYGYNYGYVPFTEKRKENLYKLDNDAIKAILSLDISAFLSHIKKFNATICGAAPILTTMFAVKNLGCKTGKLLKYYTSGDVIKDYSNAVGYASIVFV